MYSVESNDPSLSGDRLEIRYIKLKDVRLWDRNPKLGDVGAIAESILRYGFKDAPKYEPQIDGLVEGNHRTKALESLFQRDSKKVPAGILVDTAGDWWMPVMFGVDADSRRVAEQYAIDHNNLTLMGGDLTMYDIARIWDQDAYRALLVEMADDGGQLPVSVDLEDLDVLLQHNDAPPSLDDLADQFGDSVDESDYFPVIRAKVPPHLYDKYIQNTAQYGDTDDARIQGLLETL